MGCSSSNRYVDKPIGSLTSQKMVKQVTAVGFEVCDNFAFTYDAENGIVRNCISGGLAEQHSLLNWVVWSFQLPRRVDQIVTKSDALINDQSNASIGLLHFARNNAGAEVLFETGNELHARVLHGLRPLMVTFRDSAGLTEPYAELTPEGSLERAQRESFEERMAIRQSLAEEDRTLQRALDRSKYEL